MHTVDMHCHTTASDGSLTPTELVVAAAQAGLTAIGICDHDTLGGLLEAMGAGATHGVEVVPGIEISVRYPIGRLHLLGYWIDPRSPVLRERLRVLKDNRESRNHRIAARMAELGLPVTYDDMLAEAGGGQIGRPHMARVLVRKKVVDTVQEAFDRYLGKGALAHIPKDKIGLEEAFALVHEAGGIAVLAHPLTLKLDARALADELVRLRGLGLDGLECYYSQHDEEVANSLLEMAAEADLIPSGGSDFHGDTKPTVSLGHVRGSLAAPVAILDGLRRCREARRN